MMNKPTDWTISPLSNAVTLDNMDCRKVVPLKSSEKNLLKLTAKTLDTTKINIANTKCK